MNGSAFIPIESYPIDVAERNIELEKKAIQLSNEFVVLASSNARLHELMLHQLESGKLYPHYDERNKAIAADLKSRMDDSLKFYPKLFIRRWVECETINAIAFLGKEHMDLNEYTDKPEVSKHIRMSYEYYHTDTQPLHDAIIRELAQNPRPLNEREAYLMAIEKTGFGSVVSQFLKANMSDQANRLVHNALAMSLDQLRELDQNSSKIDDRTKRQIYILNTIYGEPYFGVKVGVK